MRSAFFRELNAVNGTSATSAEDVQTPVASHVGLGHILDGLVRVDHLAAQLVFELLSEFPAWCGHAVLYFQ